LSDSFTTESRRTRRRKEEVGILKEKVLTHVRSPSFLLRSFFFLLRALRDSVVILIIRAARLGRAVAAIFVSMASAVD
jgi:hypothetical protein